MTLKNMVVKIMFVSMLLAVLTGCSSDDEPLTGNPPADFDPYASVKITGDFWADYQKLII